MPSGMLQEKFMVNPSFHLAQANIEKLGRSALASPDLVCS